MILALLLFLMPDDSIAPILKRNFDSFLIATSTGQITSQSWPDADMPVPIGSLIKPFTSLAYAKQFGTPFSKGNCDGSTCWRSSGHGLLDFPHAMAVSCNTYFRNLADRLNPNELAEVLYSFGIPTTSAMLSRDARIGIGNDLGIAPSALLKAYAMLMQRQDKAILEGLRLAGLIGTGKQWKGRALVKTGTAACTKDEGDGFAFVAYPAINPKTLILVRNHRQTGAATAGKLAGVLGPLWGIR